MPNRPVVTSLNASTIDILNTIRANANSEYQSLVPEVTQTTDIPKVGEVLFGYPALANQFLNALINRIAIVRVKSALFNNPYAALKKGYLEFGQTVEEVFVQIAKAREFSVEKAADRELKRTLPDVKSAFHAMNWRVQYPVTIQDEDLRQAFMSMNGVTDMIARIVDSVYTAASYDEFLLMKYLIVKNVAHGKMYPVAVNTADIKNAGIAFRGTSNKLTFMSSKYNASGVTTTTAKADQRIFLDADFDAQYDIGVLSAAFNMDKAEYLGQRYLIDDWTSFDNERFSTIMAGSDQIEEVTDDELALMANVVGVLVDEEWFQVYDNNIKFTEKYVASGMYWNYFLNTWKTVSASPFSNAVVFVKSTASVALPDDITVEILTKSVGDAGTTLTLGVDSDNPALSAGNVNFLQTEVITQNGVAIHPFGGVVFPAGNNKEVTLVADVNGTLYTASTTISAANNVGAEITLEKE